MIFKRSFSFLNLSSSSFKESDAVAILTEWDEFKKIDFYKSKFFDGRNVLEESFYSIGKKKRK